ncbi:MAG TPA: ABC transporter ATP-binding protein [Bacillota bacterium]|nr:ABC transporter ATP-binding protein [Bacillota bacterium]
MTQIELTGVTKRFGTVTAVSNLNLQIEKGECFSFLGPSGCGKTTTLRIIAGFEDLDEGELKVAGRLFSSSYRKLNLPPEKRDFGMVFQAFAVWPHRNVFDNVAFPLQIKKLSKHEIYERTKQAIQCTGLTNVEGRFPNELSGGQQQRIALARAIAINPTVMLLDEPLSNLDPNLREEMRFEIKDLQKKFEFTIIYVTHDQAEAMALSDRMLVMSQGVVQQVDTPLNIYNHPINRFVFGFIGLSNFIPVVVSDGKIQVEGGSEAEVISTAIPETISSGNAVLAFRPSEVDFVAEGGVRGSVKHQVYLGDLIDYRIAIGTHEFRVQKPRRLALPREGEPCRIKFNRVFWYER